MRPRTLDGNWYQAFRASPYWLRFELGGEILSNVDQPVPRFIQAFHRAQALANVLFSSSTSLTAILGASPEWHAFGALEALGFRAPAPWCRWSASYPPGEEDAPRFEWRAIELAEPAMRDTLLWVSIVYEMGISPKAPVVSYLTDFDAAVVLHVYDDRGMDVRALDRASIEPLYRQFDSWLLDYDRPRMAAAFGHR
jgi:hypothetical protein